VLAKMDEAHRISIITYNYAKFFGRLFSAASIFIIK